MQPLPSRLSVFQSAKDVGQTGVRAAWERLCLIQETLLKSRAKSQGNVAVIDIGSNSVRLVVFDGVSRSPLALFNEKVLCGLGRGVGAEGRLSEDAMAMALDSLERFVHLSHAMRAKEIAPFATAAVRDASNGAQFLQQIQDRCGISVRLLSGIEEAKYSALGVLAGAPEARGLMGDLGGGSLELVGLHGRQTVSEGNALTSQNSVTLPLGLLRLMEDSGYKRSKAREIIMSHLDTLDWLPERQDFYPVGGAWRNLARIHMERTNYPLHVIHQYCLNHDEALRTLDVVERMTKNDLLTIKGVSKRRVDTLPFAALLLRCLMERCTPRSVVFSAFGVREGILYDRLNADMAAVDPLIEMCYDISHRASRFESMGNALMLFSDGLFPDDSEEERRLRYAACLLGDIGWRVHPDYRADQSYERVLQAPFSGIDHAGRAFIALAVHARYGGDLSKNLLRAPRELLHESLFHKALLLGKTMRLGFAYSGATPALLSEAAIAFEEAQVVLTVPEKEKALASGMVERRFENVAKALHMKGRIHFREA